MRCFFDHMELHLTGVGLLVTIAAASLAGHLTANVWMVVASTALVVGVVHGLVFWLVRRRQRQVRHAIIQSVQYMLKDVVKNQLAVVRLGVELNAMKPGSVDPQRIDESITQIASAVDSLSAESLRTWQNHYERT